MNASQLTWIYSISGLLYIFFYAGALVFCVLRRNQSRQAAYLAAFGISMMLSLHVIAMVAPMLLSRIFENDTFILYNGLAQILLTIARLAAFCLILAAVFAGRQPSGADDNSYSPERYAHADDNPYVPPLSR